jgi:hypothetical protein
MLSLFFKRKDYKEVTVKYLDKITNDIERLQYKRIAGMTAAQEITSKTNTIVDSTKVKEPLMDKTDPTYMYESTVKEPSRDRPSPHSALNQCSKSPILLSTEFHDFGTASSLITTDSRDMQTNDDSYDATLSSITRKGRTLSRKIMAESIENMHKEIEELRSRITIIGNAEDSRNLHVSVDSMQGEISGLKSMMTLILAETRKNEAEFIDVTDKMHEEIVALNNSIAIVSATAEQKEWSCMPRRPSNVESDGTQINSDGQVKNTQNKWYHGCDSSSCGTYPAKYDEFLRFFSVIACISSYN